MRVKRYQFPVCSLSSSRSHPFIFVYMDVVHLPFIYVILVLRVFLSSCLNCILIITDPR